MDDRHTSGGWTPAASVVGVTHAPWPESHRWGTSYEVYGHPAHGHVLGEPHAAYADTDPLFGPMPGAYGTGTPGGEPWGHPACHYENVAHATAVSWEASAYSPAPRDEGHGGQWADTTGYGPIPADPVGSDMLGSQDTAVIDAPGTPEAEPESQVPSHDETTASEGTSEVASNSSTPRDLPATRPAGGRGRRAPRRGSAFLTVVAPSVAFVGMAGISAASIGIGNGGEAVQAAPDPAVQPSTVNSQFDTQLTTLSREADDFADRATRTQERADLEQQRREEQRRRAAEAARKKAETARREALRPKFVLPVTQKGVGELFGAVGSMWSSRHTGLDFPVPMYTPVMAVTDGTVVAKWNSSYGNIVEVTGPDGTQTWYAHLASARLRSGYVKAGTVIGYAGSSGNSSGPHLHLEVHPGGGAAVDPLAWLRSHGLEPT